MGKFKSLIIIESPSFDSATISIALFPRWMLVFEDCQERKNKCLSAVILLVKSLKLSEYYMLP